LGAFYKYINKKLNGYNGIAPLKDKNGVLMTDNHSKAELLNEYFSSDNSIIEEQWQIPRSNKAMGPIFITPDRVFKAITKL